MDDRLRLSDADRDRASAVLCGHFAAGRLTREELDARLTATLRAATFGELRRVLAGLPESAPLPQQHGRLPSRAALERGYRRLVACYPARYRRVHEEEMLAVLMTAAPESKRRPGLAEAADLLLGALRVRLQPSRADVAEPAWRDALAILSVILPVVILMIPALQVTQLGAPLVLAALVLLRLRRLAALAAAAMLIWLAFFSGSGTLVNGTIDAPGYLALGLEIVALTASAGPRRGLQFLTWKHAAVTVIATLAVTTYPLTVIAIAVICAAMALTSSLSRWLLVLLAIPAYPYLLGSPFSALGGQLPPGLHIARAYLPTGLAYITSAYLPPLVLLVTAVIAARRESFRPAQSPPAPRPGNSAGYSS